MSDEHKQDCQRIEAKRQLYSTTEEEIKRLRGLLRECVPYLNGVGYDELFRKLQEELGDK